MLPPSDPVDPAKAKAPPARFWYSGATGGQWLALVAALLGWMFDGFEQGVFPIVARPALRQFREPEIRSLPETEQAAARDSIDEWVRRWNAVVTAAFLLGAAAGGLVFGWIGDRVGRVRAMVFSVLTYAVFTGLGGLAMAPWQLGALRFLASLGMGGEWSLGVALVMESWSAHARPVLAGLIGAAANVGFLLVSAVGALLNPDDNWRLIFLICVLPALLTFLLRTFVPESARWERAAASGPRARVGDIFTADLRGRSLLGAGLGAVALLATWGGVLWVPLWLGQAAPGATLLDILPEGIVQGMPSWLREHAPALKEVGLMCAALGAVVGAFLGAFLGSRLPRRLGYFALCLLSLVVCEYLFLGKMRGPFDGWFLATTALAGACSAAFYGWLPLYLPELFPTRVRATGQGFCYNAGRVLAAAGVLLTTFSVNVKGNYPLASAIVCSVYVVGLGLAWFLPETEGRPLPE